MITKYTVNGKNPNKDLYNDLFDSVNNDNDLPEINDIDSLEKYFEKLNIIVEAVQNNPSKLCHYLRLPIDEPYFEINANNRTITVPSAFASSGIGIQGEVGVETIFFQIDRYFDTIDLSTTNIQILYKTKEDSVIEDIFMKEIVDKKLIFGWSIPKQVTNTSGKIKIAIRFIKTDNDQIIYNFSTLPTEISVKPGLSLTDFTTGNNQDFVLERFEITSLANENPTE